MINHDTICAISTAPGKGAVSIIRMSGNDVIRISNQLFQAYNKKKLSLNNANTVILGNIIENYVCVDEVLITIFKAPKSYTGENVVEIACHGSTYIQSKIIQLLIKKGCRLAKKGEFTLRAFLNGKLDLVEAEGVAELIASENEQAHKLAMKQMRGGFSHEIQNLRNQFIKFASLIELELDFSQEDVEFVKRTELLQLTNKIRKKTDDLLESFRLGNAIKNGIPISIVGQPNSGKSTLLNQLLNEDRAIVSEIKGTTRDVIEESIIVEGYEFRFIDTAGLRKTNNKIEKIGIQKTYEKINQSAFVLYLINKVDFNLKEIEDEIQSIYNQLNSTGSIIIIANKDDIKQEKIILNNQMKYDVIDISAKEGKGIDKILNSILKKIEDWKKLNNEIIIINQRHFESLINTLNSIKEVEKGIHADISGEFLSSDIKTALNYLGEITGEITNEHLLDSIFKDFCIGK
ncbi:MAG: tRNA uridine-5-carboxymethylaminomethyl(34) synthesis GTPase MnmE [Flavobacteriales bacterium]|nr:tRNA uridine-5-carboxymethylaminomethyl(34) synthesis GTPase MnmE [Flavobacteriales bacterium]